MKKQSVRDQIVSAKKKVLYTGLLALLSFGNTASLLAQPPKKVPAVRISYAGTMNESPLFRIQFENESQETYHLILKDNEGNILYAEKFRDKKFSKGFLLEDVELQKAGLSFVINNYAEKQSEVYEINKKSLSVEEYVITRL